MLQIKVFTLQEDKEANNFIKNHRLIENGVQVRENCICVLYDESEEFDAKSKEVALIMKLSQAEAALLAETIKDEYYTLASEAKKMTDEMIADRQKNMDMIKNLTAQIYVIKKMLGRDTVGMVVFGHKKYADKK